MSKADESRVQLHSLIDDIVGERHIKNLLRDAQRALDLEERGHLDVTYNLVSETMRKSYYGGMSYMLIKHDDSREAKEHRGPSVPNILRGIKEPQGRYHLFILIRMTRQFSYLKGGELEVSASGLYTFQPTSKPVATVDCDQLAKRLLRDELAIPPNRKGRPIAGKNWKPKEAAHVEG